MLNLSLILELLSQSMCPPVTSHLDVAFLRACLQAPVVIAGWVRLSGEELLLLSASFFDALQTSGTTELLREQRLELGTLNGTQQDH